MPQRVRISIVVAALFVAGCAGSSKPRSTMTPIKGASPKSTRVTMPEKPRSSLVLLAETNDTETLAFVYGLCGWLASSSEVERRYDPIFIFTTPTTDRPKTPVDTAGSALSSIVELAEVPHSLRDTILVQAGVDKMITRRGDAYRCDEVPPLPPPPPPPAAPSPTVEGVGDLLGRLWSAPPPPPAPLPTPVDVETLSRPATILSLSFARPGRPGIRYFHFNGASDASDARRWGFYDLRGASLALDYQRFAAEALFDVEDALALDIENRTQRQDRCESEVDQICVYQTGQLHLLVRPVASLFYEADELEVAPPSSWTIVSLDGEPAADLVVPSDDGHIAFPSSGRYAIGIDVRAKGQAGVRRTQTLNITVESQDWMFAERRDESYAFACRPQSPVPELSSRFANGYLAVLDPYFSLFPPGVWWFGALFPGHGNCRGHDTFAADMLARAEKYRVLNKDLARDASCELREVIRGLPAPETMDRRTWRGIIEPVINEDGARELLHDAFLDTNWVEERMAMEGEGLVRRAARRESRAARLLKYKQRQTALAWCTALAKKSYARWPASSVAPPPGQTWIEKCAVVALAFVDGMAKETKPKSSAVKALVIDNGDGPPLLAGHLDDPIASVSRTADTSGRVLPEVFRARREQTVKMRAVLDDGNVSTAVPVRIEQWGRAPHARIDASLSYGLGSDGRFLSGPSSAEISYLRPTLWELVYLGYVGGLQDGDFYGGVRLALTIWCHWSHELHDEPELCRPSPPVLPYVDVAYTAPRASPLRVDAFQLNFGLRVSLPWFMRRFTFEFNTRDCEFGIDVRTCTFGLGVGAAASL